MKSLLRLSGGLLIATLTFSSGFAQQQTAQLTGRVSDASGAAIPGATVTVSNENRGIHVSVTTDQNGDYVVPLLQPDDNYVLTVSKQGFSQTVQSGVRLQVAQTAKIDVALTVGSVTQSVAVTSASPLLDTQTSSIGQVITGKTVEDMPLNGRSTFRLIALTPGVTFSQAAYGQFGDVPVNTVFDTDFVINGGRAQSNEFLIDGVPTDAGFFDQITTMPSVDDTQEFKVESSDLPAWYGRYSGGVINVSSKSGNNQLHGDVYDFARNSAFDANTWFANSTLPKTAVLPFRMNQFGGTLGGPVVVPLLYHGQDKTFFFVNYEGTRRLQGETFITSVPYAAEKTGDFSIIANTIYNPFSYNTTTNTRAQFPSNQIPSSLLDPVAMAIAQYYPAPNYNIGAVSNNFIGDAPLTVNQDVYSGRIDQNVTKRYHLFGRYAYSRTGLTQPDQFGNIADSQGAVGTTYFNNQSFAFDNIFTLSPTLLLSVDYGFARWYQIRQTLSYGFDISTLGLPEALASAISIKMFPAISISGFGGLANQSYLNNGNDSHALIVQLTKIRGRHNMVAGVDGRLHRINFFNVSNSTGTYSFTQQATRENNTTTAEGNAFASFMLGVGSSGSIPLGTGNALQDFYGAVYFQDDIRLTQKFTLNAGVRYDGESPYLDRHNRLNYFDPTLASPAANPSFANLTGGLIFAGTNGAGRAVYTRQHNNVAPRLGFAYSPDSRTVVRGSYGLSFAPLELSDNAVGFVPNLGFSSTTTWDVSNNNGVTPANLLNNPFPQGLVQITGSSLGASTELGQSVTVWTNHPSTPYAQQWNLDVQQQLSGSTLLDMGYVGSHNVHLTADYQMDQLNPQYLSLQTALNTLEPNPFQQFVSIGTLSNSTVAQSQLLLPYPQFLSVLEENDPWGSASYNALQAKLVQQASHGLTVLVAYTWSKLISNANAQNAPIGTTDNTTVQNYYDLAAERSVSELDQPQNLVTSLVLQLPFGQGQSFLNHGGITDKLIGGWRASGIWVEQSGFPLTLSTGSVAGGADRVDPVAGVSAKIYGDRNNQEKVAAWFNIAAFTDPAPYTYGTVRRTFTAVRGPGVQNLDFSLAKTTSFHDRVSAEFRAEAFNITNNPHFGMPGMDLAGTGFGTLTSTIASPPARELQFAVKILF